MEKKLPPTKGQLILKYIIICKLECLYFVDLTTFQILGQNLSNFFVGILVETMTPKGHFEIN